MHCCACMSAHVLDLQDLSDIMGIHANLLPPVKSLTFVFLCSAIRVAILNMISAVVGRVKEMQTLAPSSQCSPNHHHSTRVSLADSCAAFCLVLGVRFCEHNAIAPISH